VPGTKVNISLGGVDGQTKRKTQNLGSFVWSIAEILRGDFKQSEYGKVILPS
jgi:type I restriction-modification system DNA methylase subunit